MGRFFNQDNPVSRFLAGTIDLIALNALFILTSLPIVTMGASLTALYSVLLWRKDDDSYLYKIYFSSFKENFRQATIIWVPCCLGVLFLGYELYLIFAVFDDSLLPLQFPVWISLFLLVSIILFAFPQIAGYRQKTSIILKNSILISISNLVLTIAVLAVSFLIVDVSIHNGEWLVLFFSIYLFIGCALSVKIFSFYLKRVFRKLEERGLADSEKADPEKKTSGTEDPAEALETVDPAERVLEMTGPAEDDLEMEDTAMEALDIANEAEIE